MQINTIFLWTNMKLENIFSCTKLIKGEKRDFSFSLKMNKVIPE